MIYWIGVCLALVLARPAAADEAIETLLGIAPRHYVAQRTAGQIVVDGRLDEPDWQRAPWTEFFVDIEGGQKPEPRFKTRAKMLWDDTYFYVAADLEEPHVWATLTRRDATIYHDNDFEVFIDPNGDTHEYYEFEINAYGTEWDLFLVKPYRDGGPYMNAWDIAGLKSGVKVWGTLDEPRDVDRGWSVELAFPWAVLKECAHRPTPPQDGDQWRVNFSRVQWPIEIDKGRYSKVKGQREDNWVWSPQGVINMHFPEQWGYVQFSTQTVGKGPARFVAAPEVEAKRVLREIYYRQRQIFKSEGRYVADLDSLGVAPRRLRHFRWPPVVRVSEHQFEAFIDEAVDPNGDGEYGRWIIRQDSKTWRE